MVVQWDLFAQLFKAKLQIVRQVIDQLIDVSSVRCITGYRCYQHFTT